MTHLCTKDTCVLLGGGVKLLRVAGISNMVERCACVMSSQRGGLCCLLVLSQPQAHSTFCTVIQLLDH